jgi:predicted outer membrane repeat protein
VGPNVHTVGGSCADPDFRTDGVDDQVQVQAAVDAALAGDTVTICAATYYFSDDVNVGIDLTFTGAGQTLTVIDGQDTTRLINSTADLSIAEMTLQNANSDGMSDCISGYEDGGAVCANGLLSLDSTSFLNNYSGDWGGAVAAGEVQVSQSLFRNNETVNDGGAIVTEALGGSESQIVSTTFEQNIAGSDGGAIRTNSGFLEIVDSLFIRNLSRDDGGAVDSGFLVVSDSSFIGNRAAQDGGAVRAQVIYIPDSKGNAFRRNIAGGAGGAVAITGMNRQALQFKRGNRFFSNRSGVLFTKDLFVR